MGEQLHLSLWVFKIPVSMTIPITCPPKVVVMHENEVPLWSVEDVVAWVSRAGFQEYSSAFNDCGVDGDMLLQLTEEEIYQRIEGVEKECRLYIPGWRINSQLFEQD